MARVRETKRSPSPAGGRSRSTLSDRDRFDTATPAPRHPNTMRFVARDGEGGVLADETWLSVGGGFIVREGEAGTRPRPKPQLPYPFRSGAELLARGREAKLSIAELMRPTRRRCAPKARPTPMPSASDVMFACVDPGLTQSGPLPGGLKVMRRAKAIHDRLIDASRRNFHPAHEIMDFVGVYAMAVNEENAAGGRVVTAPTNGAAGVIPAVHALLPRPLRRRDRAGLTDFLLTATAIGALFKHNASISGAEVGCQGEVGVASSMAAAGLCAVIGGTNEQIENAAEIAMEHHLGMTCDPIGGLVQIPCIERNAFGAVKAIAAARWRCTATARTASRSTASSRPCARPAPTCSRSTRRRAGRARGQLRRVLRAGRRSWIVLAGPPFRRRKRSKLGVGKARIPWILSSIETYQWVTVIFRGIFSLPFLVVRAALVGSVGRLSLSP